MLEKEYCQDYTIGHDIIHEFKVDETQLRYVKEQILKEIDSCKGLSGKFRKKIYKEYLEELENIKPCYITDNNFLCVFEDNIKIIYDLSSCYDLCKMPNEQHKSPKGSAYFTDFLDNCWVYASVDSSGFGRFEINEDGTEEGFFGFDDGVYSLSVWNVYEPDLYSVLLSYIKPVKDVETLPSLSEF